MPKTPAFAPTLLAGAALLALAGCGRDDSNPTWKTNVKDKSGGELIVTKHDPQAIPVRVPNTPMTPVPRDTASPTGTASPGATPGATGTTPAATPTPAATR